MTRKLGRPKSGQEPLTRERILAAALRLVDEQGVEALSMRRLAAELAVDPMAIYHYLPNKRAILAGLIELVFAGWPAPPAAGLTWQEQVRDFARAYHQLTRAHPSLVLYLVTEAEFGAKAALAATESLYVALAGAGLSPRLIIQAADLIVDYLNGFALAESSGRFGQPGERQELLTQLHHSPPEQFSTLRRVLASVPEADLAANFEAGLDLILAGLAAVAGESSAV